MALKHLGALLGNRFEDLRLSAWRAYNRLAMPVWQRMALRNKALYCAKYVVVTGSCGKSTTTSLIGRLAGAQGSVSTGIYDNMQRHALRQLRKLTEPTDVVVQETTEFPAGTLGAIAALHPDVTVITAIGLDHATQFRNLAAIRREMATLTSALSPTAVLCLNADDDEARTLAADTAARVVLFGTHPDAHVRAENVQSQWPGCLRFDLVTDTSRRRVTTRFVGRMMLTNIVGALAAVEALGLDLDQAIADLAGFEPLPNRMSVIDTPGGHTFLCDTRKAPIWSSRLAVADLGNMTAGRRILVLGDMSDITSEPSRKYRQVMRRATADCDLVIGIGYAARPAGQIKRNEPHLNVVAAESVGQLQSILAQQPPSFVFIKAYRPNLDGFDFTAPAADAKVGA